MGSTLQKCEFCGSDILSQEKFTFDCEHNGNYCSECVKEVFTYGIQNDKYESLKCLNPDCKVKASPSLIHEIVDENVFDDYRPEHNLTEDDSDCPKCAAYHEELTIESEQLYGFCHSCEYTYCTNCGKEYHGFDSSDCASLDVTAERLNNLSLAHSSVECGICFEEFDEVSVDDLGCGHSYCKHCLKMHVETKIKERAVHKIACPNPECNVEADATKIQQIVPPEMYSKYDDMLLSDYLGRNAPEIVNCPNINCQQRVVADPEFGHCKLCETIFCTECNGPFHGLSPCGQSEEERRVDTLRYIAATEAEKLEMERQQQEKWRKQNQESDRLIKRVCKKCPNCSANIEKNEGCNHMHCSECDTSFCWLCLKIIDKGNPHAHFIGKCKLFYYPES